MRRISVLLAIVGVALLPVSVQAQTKPKLQVSGVRIGFTGSYAADEGTRQNVFKAGCWAPVFIDLQASRDGLRGTEGRILVEVETPDSDDVQTKYTVDVALEKLGPNEQFTVPTFAKLANVNGEITVRLYYEGQELGQPYKRQQGQPGIDANQAVYLLIGSRLANLRKAMQAEDVNNNAKRQFDARENLAYIDSVTQMPQHWFGYDGVDLVILTTGSRDFLLRLASADKRYREALAEWVMRGGHLVISVGQNHDAVTALAELQNLLPVQLVKPDSVVDLRMDWRAGNAGRVPKFPAGSSIAVAVMAPKRDRLATPLLQETTEQGIGKGRDLIVQGAAGLGRVTVVAFDIDQRPFIDWKGSEANQNPHADFYKQLLTLAWPRNAMVRPEAPEDQQQPPGVWRGNMTGDDPVVGHLYAYLENFEEVPVISFGWVALFIFLYILVVGPLDYFFLKKVVKRLELTWITFPTVVLTISAVAYFTAYYIKGKDLRIRKVDLVDVDMTSSQPLLTGQTWFTLFSPRIKNYTVGLEPAPGEWVADTAAGTRPADVTISWLGRPSNDPFGGRTRGQSLFRRAYDYEPAATGLHGVPIQVWSTKSFTASWQAPADPQHPLCDADLHQLPDASGLKGKLTWLPGVDGTDKPDLRLREAILVYNNRVAKLELAPGKTIDVDTDRDAHQEISQWYRDAAPVNSQQNNNNYPPQRYGRNAQGQITLDQPLRSALFFEEFHHGVGNEQNSGLRSLDQSWRLHRKGEAILIGRFALPPGSAEEISQHRASPTRLWLDALPSSGQSRPRLEGILHQDTYVRIFLPVQEK